MHTIPVMLDRGDGDPMGEEATLIRAAQRDRGAFGPLYQRYANRVYAYLRARTGVAEDADDLTQQVFLHALDALPRYRFERTPFAAWLFRIAHNVAVDFHRRQRQTVAWDFVPEALQPIADDDLDTRVMREENLARLRTLFAALDRDTRELLVLRFTAQLAVAEIAAVIGASPGATKMRLVRALRTLKEHYHDDTL